MLRKDSLKCTFSHQPDVEKFQYAVTPAEAGGQKALKRLDSRFRGNDITGREKTFSNIFNALNGKVSNHYIFWILQETQTIKA